MTHTPLRARLDLDALVSNLAEVRALAGPRRRVIAALKANAYGHGAAAVARALADAGVDEIATGSLDEVAAIRAAGVDAPVMLFATVLPGDPRVLRELDVTPTVCSAADAERLRGSGADPMPVYLKVDSGLGRLGVPLGDADAVIDVLADMDGVTVRGVYTHLPFSKAERAAWAAGRLAAFRDFLAGQGAKGRTFEVTQAGASCCLLAGVDDGCNSVCVGHLLYGLSPFSGALPEDFTARFRPVLSRLATTLVHVGRHGQGADLAIAGAYGIDWDRVLGVLPVGLAHGIGRPAPGREAWCRIRGRRVPIVAVSLEHTTVALDRCPEAATGDEVVLLDASESDPITLDDIAGWLGCSPLETVMRLSGRFSVSAAAP